MIDCGHVFCVQCLQDFYNNAITEGDLATVRCLAPNCAKEREAAGKRGRKPKIRPSELLEIPLEREVVQRYVNLSYKNELETDKNTIYCPRSWCNGAARSKKHKRPEGLEFAPESDSESEGEEDEVKTTEVPTWDLLSICEDCGFAFCKRCLQSWHGEYVRCAPPRDKGELSEEEKASLAYLELHTTPCPTCACPVQKTHGCNHMVCYRCDTHFCYLCSTWLDAKNPYAHYNEKNGRVTGCHMRLWELEAGDGDDVGLGFEGGANRQRAPVEGQRPHAAEAGGPRPIPPPEIEEPDDEPAAEARPRVVAPPANGGQVGIAREGPLVFRIAAEPARLEVRDIQAVAAPVPPQRHQQQQRGQRGARRGGRGAGGGAAGGRERRDNQGRNDNARGGGQQQQQRRGGGGDNQGARDLNEAHQAWIRHFVQLALDDNEHLVADDSDEDEEEVVFWRDDEAGHGR
jgi:E3 ubiquitin-protein ligase RNF14